MNNRKILEVCYEMLQVGSFITGLGIIISNIYYFFVDKPITILVTILSPLLGSMMSGLLNDSNYYFYNVLVNTHLILFIMALLSFFVMYLTMEYDEEFDKERFSFMLSVVNLIWALCSIIIGVIFLAMLALSRKEK